MARSSARRRGLALTGAMLPAGSHQVSVTVRDTTALVRSDPTSLLVSSKAWTLTTSGTTVFPDKGTLRFAAVSNGAAFVSQTGAQSLRLMQSGTGPGELDGNLESAVAHGLAVRRHRPRRSHGGHLAGSRPTSRGEPHRGDHVRVGRQRQSCRANRGGPADVSRTASSAPPIGFVDTPLDNTSGVVGAIPFTGWAVDDVEVARVTVCRDAVAGESAPLDPNCSGAAQIYVGDALFIDGARPDVQASYPGLPRASEAGWGLMVLTNMLPGGGNGPYGFSMYAIDREGHAALIGTRRLSASNATATLPFGTIDTPAPGETIGGSAYVNFGWALTPQPKSIPADGSTINVYVDGAAIGHVSYNNYRVDIATLFPGYNNSLGAIGFRILNTTLLADGLHTIAWTATDNLGATEGLGSRYFRVMNSGAVVAAPPARTARVAAAVRPADLDPAAIATLPEATAPLSVRRGWAADAPLQHLTSTDGPLVVRGEELDRFEVQLGGTGRFAGYLRVESGLRPLPTGSQLDPRSGIFLWAPGAGFIGRYDLVFVRWDDGRPVSRQEVQIRLEPKGHGHVGPQVVIDAPTAQQAVGQPFALGGWAADLDALSGTGIDTLHVWAYPVAGGAPMFVGTATAGGLRPDVAVVYGDQFRAAGYGLIVQGLAPGTYDLAVFAWSHVVGGFVPAAVVRVTVQ